MLFTHEIMAALSLLLCKLFLLSLVGKALPEPALNNVHGQMKTRVIQTKYGRLQGIISRVGRDAESQKHVEIYLGIPYASPPIGNFRFSPTRPPIHWSGVRSTFSFGPVCPQKFPDLSNRTKVLLRMPKERFNYLKKIQSRLIHESEDCLHLNLYVPYIKEERDVEFRELFPVMVFLHGESYSWGSGNLYDGRVLASYGRVIVVTFNYRLGVFGFLNTNVSPHRKPSMANYGLMDQIAVLKWIQENIRNFGGDPERVTLFGHKHGAACIQFLMQSPAVVPGLFHRAIMMSGSALSDWAIVNDPVHYAVQLSAHLNCTLPRNMLNDHLKIITCLRQKRIEDLTSFDFGEPSFLTAMGPSRDGILIPWDFGSTNALIHKRSNSPSYQVIIGMVEDETNNLFAEIETKFGMGPGGRDRYFRTLIRNTYTYHLNEIFATIQNEYTDWMAVMGDHQINPRKILWQTSKALTDKLYVGPILQSANWCNESGFKTYLYVYKHSSEFMATSKEGYGSKGSNVKSKGVLFKDFGRSQTGSMLPIVLGLPFAPELTSFYSPFNSQQGVLAQNLLAYWSNFAISGNPNQPNSIKSLFKRNKNFEDPAQSLTPWETYNIKSQKYLEMDTPFVMGHHFRLHTMSIWLNLIPKLHGAGENNIFPQHNAFMNHDNPDLFIGIVRPSSYSHGYQVNRNYLESIISTTGAPSTTCLPVELHLGKSNRYSDGDNTILRLEQASAQANRQAMYMTIGIGVILLTVNVWFLICLFFCRSRLKCIGLATPTHTGHGMGRKENSCETEIGSVSLQSETPVQEGCHRNGSRSSSSGSVSRRPNPSESIRLLQVPTSAASSSGYRGGESVISFIGESSSGVLSSPSGATEGGNRSCMTLPRHHTPSSSAGSSSGGSSSGYSSNSVPSNCEMNSATLGRRSANRSNCRLHSSHGHEGVQKVRSGNGGGNNSLILPPTTQVCHIQSTTNKQPLVSSLKRNTSKPKLTTFCPDTTILGPPESSVSPPSSHQIDT